MTYLVSFSAVPAIPLVRLLVVEDLLGLLLGHLGVAESVVPLEYIVMLILRDVNDPAAKYELVDFVLESGG